MKSTMLMAASLTLILPLASEAGTYGRASYRSYHEPTLYVYGGVGATEFNFDNNDYRYSFGDGSQGDIEINSDSTGVRFGLGMNLTREIAIEFGYVELGDLSSSAFSDGSQVLNDGFAAGPVRMDGTLSGGMLGIRLDSPRNEPIGAFARLGFFGWQFDGTLEDSAQRGHFTVEGSDPYVGLGLRMEMTPNADVQLSYDYYPLEADDRSMDFSADSISVDLVLRF